jgi:hypothetical protein
MVGGRAGVKVNGCTVSVGTGERVAVGRLTGVESTAGEAESGGDGWQAAIETIERSEAIVSINRRARRFID